MASTVVGSCAGEIRLSAASVFRARVTAVLHRAGHVAFGVAAPAQVDGDVANWSRGRAGEHGGKFEGVDRGRIPTRP